MSFALADDTFILFMRVVRQSLWKQLMLLLEDMNSCRILCIKIPHVTMEFGGIKRRFTDFTEDCISECKKVCIMLGYLDKCIEGIDSKLDEILSRLVK